MSLLISSYLCSVGEGLLDTLSLDALPLSGEGQEVPVGYFGREERGQPRREGWRYTALLIGASSLNFVPNAPCNVMV